MRYSFKMYLFIYVQL